MARLALRVLTIAGCTSATTIRELRKTRFMTQKFWRVRGILGSQGEREEESVVQGLCIIGMKGEVPKNFVSSFFIGKFKTAEIRK